MAISNVTHSHILIAKIYRLMFCDHFGVSQFSKRAGLKKSDGTAMAILVTAGFMAFESNEILLDPL